MNEGAEALHEHLAGGIGQVARCWAVRRKDGVQMGFTDHDRNLTFAGITFRADTGLSARALQQATGLSVDNTEAMGALSDAAIREEDIAAGRYDEAEVTAWLVHWADVSARRIMFRGQIGELRRGAGAFHAELRGLTEALNRPVGRVFQKPCSAVLADATCRFDLDTPGYVYEGGAAQVEDQRRFIFAGIGSFEPGWFQRGRLEILDGEAAGLSGAIKRDRIEGADRVVELWEPIRASMNPGVLVRLEAGCDKRFETCRLKFNNGINFQGFPDIPEEDWMFVHATQAKNKTGGSRR
ncbi:DUF2163 domain-containing protein [Thalassococcus lentus]|uniref:DUF2163 domain-containing protein n=1 Tax=Thalassococcus lentus TaxID=1210524 RepID=A0ABT4XRS3_9RHOB|nr:DUF2163 domain-containing protein [Thalassococcus lentus]MDA7424664.1 DUF2163 domain-containing protein [Thalassococcus lentus]